MRTATVTVTSALGAVVGAAVVGVFYAARHIFATTTYGWIDYRPRRYVDYLRSTSDTTGTLSSWVVLLLLAVAIGAVIGAALGVTATLAGFRVSRTR